MDIVTGVEKMEIKKSIKSHKKLAVVLAVMLLIGGVITAVKNGSATSDAATEIKESQAAVGDVANTISATGTLSEDSSINIKVPEGIKITDVLVSEGDKVKKGEVLAKVDRASVAETLIGLEETKEEIEDLIDGLTETSDTSSTDYLKKIVYDDKLDQIAAAKTKLKEMLDSGAIKATKKGTVTSAAVEEGSEVKSSDTSETQQKTASATTASTITFAAATAATTAETSTTGTSETVKTEVTKDDSGITNDDLSTLTVTKPETGKALQERVASTSKYDADIDWDKSGNDYTATVELTSKDGFYFTAASCYDIDIDGGTIVSGTPKVTGGETTGNKLVIKVSFKTAGSGSADVSNDKGSSSSQSVNSGQNASSGENTENSDGSNGSNSSSAQSGSNVKGNASGSDSAGNASSGNASGSASSGNTSGSTSSASDTSADSSVSGVSMVTCFSLSDDQKMTVTVSVDETDINSVKAGQTASVTMDAIEGKSFDGTITKVSAGASSGSSSSGSSSSSSSSGSVKYQATVEIDKTSKMKAGMTAAVTINIEEANDVITIPSAALNEENGTTFVYTEKDGDELSGKKEVTTGLSNGSTVEVTGGLEEGDKVYYEIKTKDSSGNSEGKGGMPGMGGKTNGNGGMQGPPSGDMPQGAPGGQS